MVPGGWHLVGGWLMGGRCGWVGDHIGLCLQHLRWCHIVHDCLLHACCACAGVVLVGGCWWVGGGSLKLPTVVGNQAPLRQVSRHQFHIGLCRQHVWVSCVVVVVWLVMLVWAIVCAGRRRGRGPPLLGKLYMVADARIQPRNKMPILEKKCQPPCPL